MFTVKQAAQLTGIPEATLRMWERRYKVVQPHRSSSGYRLYDDRQVGQLREMAAHVRSGVPASLAARAVLSSAANWPGPAEEAVPGDLVTAATSLDSRTLKAVIDTAFAAADFAAVSDGWVLPQVRKLGEAWADGRLTVAQEHFASAGLMRAIGAAFDQAPLNEGPAVLVGLPEDEQHQIGLYCFATCLRRRGVNVVYLGADVPTDEWLRAAAESAARAAVIGVRTRKAAARAREVVDRLAEAKPPVTAWVGGASRSRVPGAHQLPDAVGEAAAILDLSLQTGRA